MICEVELNRRFLCLSKEEAFALAELGKCEIVKLDETVAVFQCESCDIFNRAALVKSVNGRRIRKEKPNIERSVKTLDFITARLMVNLARVTPNSRVWEPFVGTGAIAYEIERVGGYVIGGDIDEKILRIAQRNIRGDVVIWDATYPPLREVDAAVGDPPYGRLSTSMMEIRALLYMFINVASLYIKRNGYIVFASPIYVDIPFLKSCTMYLHGGLYRVIYIERV